MLSLILSILDNLPTRKFHNLLGRSHMFYVLKNMRRLGFMPNTIIDVGVADGTPEIYLNFPSSTIYLIEPLHEYFPKLRKVLRRYNSVLIPLAASNVSGSARINLHPAHLPGSSLLKESAGEQYDGIQVDVQVRSLDQMFQQPLERPLLLKIDVQGAEHLVLEGASHLMESVDLCIFEVSLMRFMDTSILFRDYLNLMDNYGFACYDIGRGLYRPLDNALAQVDLYFVKKSSPLLSNSSFYG